MGQGGVGKTAMVLRYTTGDFNEQVCVSVMISASLMQYLWYFRHYFPAT